MRRRHSIRFSLFRKKCSSNALVRPNAGPVRRGSLHRFARPGYAVAAVPPPRYSPVQEGESVSVPEYRIERRQFIPAPVEEVFAFFADAANLDRITPPWLHFRILTPLPIPMAEGALIDYRIRWKIVPLCWRSRIESWQPPHRFVDTQVRGPYRLWHHTHTFEPDGAGTRMTDVVRYRLRLGPLLSPLHPLLIRPDLEAIFDYRREAIEGVFGVAARAAEAAAWVGAG